MQGMRQETDFLHLYRMTEHSACAVLPAGIKRVALLDFDVHHGNGTEACVAATAPSLRSFKFKTPFSEGSQTFPSFSPWLDTDDAENILFAR